MPAKRLPWIKFWPELLEHRKFGELSDAESWTWVVVWGKASQQPERWKFASIEHAVRATGRPRRQIKRLVDVHLVDEDAGGRLTIHDVKQWQDRFPSEDPTNTPSSNAERSLNGAANAPPTLPEDSVNTPSLLREDSVNVSRDEDGRREKRELRPETVDKQPASGGLATRARTREAPSAALVAEHERLLAQERARRPASLPDAARGTGA